MTGSRSSPASRTLLKLRSSPHRAMVASTDVFVDVVETAAEPAVVGVEVPRRVDRAVAAGGRQRAPRDGLESVVVLEVFSSGRRGFDPLVVVGVALLRRRPPGSRSSRTARPRPGSSAWRETAKLSTGLPDLRADTPRSISIDRVGGDARADLDREVRGDRGAGPDSAENLRRIDDRQVRADRVVGAVGIGAVRRSRQARRRAVAIDRDRLERDPHVFEVGPISVDWNARR